MATSPKSGPSGPIESQDPLKGDKQVTVENKPGEHLIDKEGKDHVLPPGSTDPNDPPDTGSPVSGPMQVSSKLMQDSAILDSGKLDQLSQVKESALHLFQLFQSIGNSAEIEQAGLKIREAVMWMHNHLFGDSPDKPRMQPPGSV